jgi:hypothetical protein
MEMPENRNIFSSINPFNLFYISYRILKTLFFYFYRFLAYFILFIPNSILKSQNKFIFHFIQGGIGDFLVLTNVVEFYSKKGQVVIVTNSNIVRDIFLNFDVLVQKPTFLQRTFSKIINASPYPNIIGCFENPVFMNKKKIHLREARLNKRKDVYSMLVKEDVQRNSSIKFSKNELFIFNKKYSNLLKNNYGIIISGSYQGKLQFVKNWGKQNMQKIVENTKVKWVQVGEKNEPLLENTFLDLRGKTSIRELFFLVSKSKLIVTTEGMLTHLSSAFQIPCITIFSGFSYCEL